MQRGETSGMTLQASPYKMASHPAQSQLLSNYPELLPTLRTSPVVLTCFQLLDCSKLMVLELTHLSFAPLVRRANELATSENVAPLSIRHCVS